MPKRKGLGREMAKSLEAIEELLKALKKFTNMPIKKGLSVNDIDDKDIIKNVNESLVESYSLINKIEDLETSMKNIKPKGNSRFANRVVDRFFNEINN